MGYFLGVDLGTTYSAAATRRGDHTAISALSDRSPMVPSVLLLRDDDSILVGDAADRRAVVEPDRVAREFKRRFGDPAPLIVGGSPYGADLLTARLLRWIVDRVAEREGGLPDGIALTHPANWGNYKLDLLHQAVRRADLAEAIPWATISEPQAAATWYARYERVEPGTVVAVYDLGGGTFDAAVLRRTTEGFDLLGQPEGIERLGGIDFDAAVFGHVVGALGDAWDALDEEDPAVRASVAALRRECVEAKEALSGDSQVTIPVALPALHTEVRLTRSEFEDMVRPTLADTVGALRRALRGAEVEPEQVDKVLLVGGSSRIPLVAQVVGVVLGRPIAIDAHPKHAVALGAAVVAAAAADEAEAMRSATGAVPVLPLPPGAAPPPAPWPDPAAADARDAPSPAATPGGADVTPSPPRPAEAATVAPPAPAFRDPQGPTPPGPPTPAPGVPQSPAPPGPPTPAPGHAGAPAPAEPAPDDPQAPASPGAPAQEPGDAEAPASSRAPEPTPGAPAPAAAPADDPDPTQVEQVRRLTASGQEQDPRAPVVVPAPKAATPTRQAPAAPSPTPAHPPMAASPGPSRGGRRRRRRRSTWRRVAATVTILVLLAAIAVAAAALASKQDEAPNGTPADAVSTER
jgi:molecular chaperone DnaK